MEYLLAFGSAHRALKAEGVLKGGGIAFRLLPAPRVLAEYCDLVISVSGDLLEEALRVLRDDGVGPQRVFKREGEGYVEV
ncbi:MAG TPA: DUF3343 domain-containing protein [Thermodesulfobacteriota bacterium]|nr:DUF3343 domain-containing protein [Thermodesulfobacteriota bacterium]